MLIFKRADHFLNVIDHGFKDVRSNGASAKRFCQRDDTDGQRCPGCHRRPVRLTAGCTIGGRSRCILALNIKPDEFRGAAADVKHQHIVGTIIDQRRAAGDGKAGFGLPAQDFDVEIKLLFDPRQKRIAVAGNAAGLCRHAAHALRAAAVEFGRAYAQCLDGPVHGGIGQQTRLRHAFSKPDDA